MLQLGRAGLYRVSFGISWKLQHSLIVGKTVLFYIFGAVGQDLLCQKWDHNGAKGLCQLLKDSQLLVVDVFSDNNHLVSLSTSVAQQ